MEKIHIGTSGWSYKHWKDIFYPKGVKNADWLTYYSQFFSIAEINSSFYRMPLHEHVLQWMEKVPEHFFFCPKLSRYLTHMKKLKEPEEPLERFFDVFAPMQKRMGPVLVQLPPMLPFDYNRAEHLYGLFKKLYSKYAFVMEIRHKSWLHNDSLTLMAGHDVGFVISQSNNIFPYEEAVTAKNIYIRFHGPEALYASAYSTEQLQYYADRCKNWVTEGHEVWAFFNNDIHGHAFRDAQRLQELVNK